MERHRDGNTEKQTDSEQRTTEREIFRDIDTDTRKNDIQSTDV